MTAPTTNQTSAALARLIEEFVIEDSKFDDGDSQAANKARELLKQIREVASARKVEIKSQVETRRAAKAQRQAAKAAKAASNPN
jgi:hypothetical protein